MPHGVFYLLHKADDRLGGAVELPGQILLEMAPVVEKQLAEKTQQFVAGTGIGIRVCWAWRTSWPFMLDAAMP